MKRTAILVAVLALSLAACKKKADEATPATPAPAPAAAGPAAPFTGKLTIARILAAKDLVKPFEPWAPGLAKLKAQLGEPIRVMDDQYDWAVVEGDDCGYLYVTKEDGAKFQMTGEIVGAVMEPLKLGKDTTLQNRDECLQITGVTAGPAEDPDAPGPPTDGAAVAADGFRTDAIAGRSKWKDQKVAVAGVYASASTSTSGADAWTTVNLKATDADTGKVVGCMQPKNAPAPTLPIGSQVVATGTVKIQEWTSGAGTTLEAALVECTVAAAKK